MKKIIALCAFLFTIGLVKAQTDNSRLEFEYYPEANVYYNIKAQSYWYFDSAAKKWESAAKLPDKYSISGSSKKTKLYSDNPEIWQKNASHVRMFGNKSASTKSPGQR